MTGGRCRQPDWAGSGHRLDLMTSAVTSRSIASRSPPSGESDKAIDAPCKATEAWTIDGTRPVPGMDR